MSRLSRLALLLSVAVTVAVLPAGAAVAAPSACADVPEDGMDDVGPVHESAVDCLVAWDITRGVGVGRFGPGTPTTRAQMATFLAATLEREQVALPSSPARSWPDVRGVHAGSVDRLAALGVLTDADAPGGQFRPAAPLDRASMAAWMARAHAAAGRPLGDPATATDAFTDDDGHRYEGFINVVAAAGVTSGYGGGRFGPDDPVSRAQMASFLTRLLDVAVADTGVARPAPSPRGTDRYAAPAVGSAPPAADGWAYRNFDPNDPDRPITYDPCAPLHVRINFDGAPAGAARIVADAVDDVAARSGLRIVVDGATTETLPSSDVSRDLDRARAANRGYGDTPPILVAWPASWAHGDAGGIGGSVYVYGDQHPAAYVTGKVLLRRDLTDPDMVGVILRHELGHVLGLDHAGDGQLMSPTVRADTTWTAGDRYGMWQVGAGSGGCHR